MIQYFFDSLMGTMLLCGLMTFVVGSVWVFVIATRELIGELGWKNFGTSVLKKNTKRLRR